MDEATDRFRKEVLARLEACDAEERDIQEALRLLVRLVVHVADRHGRLPADAAVIAVRLPGQAGTDPAYYTAMDLLADAGILVRHFRPWRLRRWALVREVIVGLDPPVRPAGAGG